ncbi:efflux transporter outer membrane subunit [Tellurirhabdus bombi]|uniref:efflux transporter outer membrane subunit n=1 Tax=Tellurirhabdus bombi TaxID=2907205 RepID=UPI001F2AD854|nr:efflux transporter outer membrane subunit [Tellurirhabdus bombi]
MACFYAFTYSIGRAQSIDLQGWHRFNDPTLDSLISQGVRENADVKIAISRIEEARRRVRIAESFLQPSVRSGISATTQSLAPNRPFQLATVSDAQRQRFQLNTFQVLPVDASYELDLFKRIRNTIAVNSYQAQAIEADFRAVRLIVASEIARLYWQIRSNDAEQIIFRRNINSRDTTVSIIESRYKAGLVNRLDVLRAQTDLANLRTQIQALERVRAELVNGLAQLLALEPATFLLEKSDLPTAWPVVPFTAISADLLRRRPDLQSAERQNQAAGANVSVARAARMPRLALNGSLGTISGQIGPLLLPGSFTYLLGANALIPLFEGGRNRQNVALANQQLTTSQATYQQRFQVAQREAEVALDNLVNLRLQLDAQAQALTLARETERYNRELYVRGLTTYLEVLDAQRTILASEQTFVQLRGQEALQTVALLRALGGDF